MLRTLIKLSAMFNFGLSSSQTRHAINFHRTHGHRQLPVIRLMPFCATTNFALRMPSTTHNASIANTSCSPPKRVRSLGTSKTSCHLRAMSLARFDSVACSGSALALAHTMRLLYLRHHRNLLS